MKHPESSPWWLVLVPDVRGWASVGGIGLTVYILYIVQRTPTLLSDAAFMQFATLIVGGTITLVYANLFGGTKAGTDNAAKMADTVAASAPPVAPVIVTAALPVDPATAIAAINTQSSQAALTAWRAANAAAMELAGVEQAWNARWDALT